MNTLKPDFIPVYEPLLLGMHRAEIKKKFDEIVDFAEIEKSLDVGETCNIYL